MCFVVVHEYMNELIYLAQGQMHRRHSVSVFSFLLSRIRSRIKGFLKWWLFSENGIDTLSSFYSSQDIATCFCSVLGSVLGACLGLGLRSPPPPILLLSLSLCQTLRVSLALPVSPACFPISLSPSVISGPQSPSPSLCFPLSLSYFDHSPSLFSKHTLHIPQSCLSHLREIP